MSEQPARPGHMGTIDGESIRFATHHLDSDAGTITITAIQRGTRALERLQRAMTRDQMTVTLPDDPHRYVATPASFGVTTTGSGEQAFHRARLVLRLKGNVHQLSDPAMAPFNDDLPDAPQTSSEVVVDRLNRLEAKLDRILSLLERDRES